MDAHLATLYARVDAFFQAAVQARSTAFACRAGCDGCCQFDLTLFGVEATLLRVAFQALEPAARARVVERARSGSTCVFRDPHVGTCDVYASRPLICRTHGLAILVDGRLDTCPLNYREGWPAREHVLDLERVNQPLAVLNRLAGHDDTRTSLRELVLAEAGDG